MVNVELTRFHVHYQPPAPTSSSSPEEGGTGDKLPERRHSQLIDKAGFVPQ